MRASGMRETIGLVALLLGAAHSYGGEREAAASRPGRAVAGTVSPSPVDLGMLVRSGWVQIVRFEAPVGGRIEIASSSGIVEIAVPGHVALATGHEYHLRVSHVHDGEPVTLYPTLRLVGYLMPPAGVDPLDHPIPIHFIHQDFEDALAARLVQNFVYLEDPLTALPLAFPAGEVPIVDVAPGEDPFRRAAEMGRPLVMIQLGNRVPLDGEFGAAATGPVYAVPATLINPPAGARGGPGDRDSMVTSAAGRGTVPGASGAAVRQAGWHLPVPGSAMAGPAASVRQSTPACCIDHSVVRLPYRVHPRMPRDEYLCDGGDEVPYAHFTAFGDLIGLGASETAAQFVRSGEPPRLVTSNQVCLYSPRFGLVRSSSASSARVHTLGTRHVDHRLRRASVQGRTATAERQRQEDVLALRRRQRPSSVAVHEPLGAVDELRVIAAMYKHLPHDYVAGHMGSSVLDQAADARIAMAVQAARAWNRDQFPSYTALTESGAQITGYLQTGEVQQIKEPIRSAGDLVLTKTVTPDNARQGEIVEFAIYYRNIGQRPVEDVSIIDSLTARLEYVPDSARTDRRAVFTAVVNDVDSHELRWDISDPIPGGQGGVVWFKARVR